MMTSAFTHLEAISRGALGRLVEQGPVVASPSWSATWCACCWFLRPTACWGHPVVSAAVDAGTVNLTTGMRPAGDDPRSRRVPATSHIRVCPGGRALGEQSSQIGRRTGLRSKHPTAHHQAPGFGVVVRTRGRGRTTHVRDGTSCAGRNATPCRGSKDHVARSSMSTHAGSRSSAARPDSTMDV